MQFFHDLSHDDRRNESASQALLSSATTSRGWDFLGAAPVPIRQLVFQGFARTLAERPPRRKLKACFPMGQGGYSPFEELLRVEPSSDWPGMIVSADDELLTECTARPELRGVYRAIPRPAANEALARFADPEGQASLFAIAPFVWLVDLRRLGALRVPRSWEALLDPRYRGQVVLGGWKRAGAGPLKHYNAFLLRALHTRFGDDGLRALSRNVAGFLHSAQMPRVAGSPASPGAIYVLPWSLADLCPRRGVTEVVWPSDGALAYPLWAAVKREREDLEPLAEYLVGADLAALLDRNRYPSARSGHATLPPGGRFFWPGWDWIRAPSAAAQRDCARRVFFADRLEAAAPRPPGIACGRTRTSEVSSWA